VQVLGPNQTAPEGTPFRRIFVKPLFLIGPAVPAFVTSITAFAAPFSAPNRARMRVD
jgi:hypothetical protein